MNRFLKLLLAILFGAVVGSYLVPRVNAWWSPEQGGQSRVVTPRPALPANERDTIDLFRRASPSVVFITTRASRQVSPWSRAVADVAAGEGSGILWDDQGHVVTNFHVLAVEGVSGFIVTLSDQSRYEAEPVAWSRAHDLAVLRINAPKSKLTPLDLGTSDDLEVGQSVFAIGNPFGWDQSLSTGVVSALNRRIRSQSGQAIDDVIQTDAAINPGNSGGPLLDSAGRLIGVNTAIYSPSGSNAGVGFAIPVNTVNRVVSQLISKGFVPRPVLGIRVDQRASRIVTRRLGVKGLMIYEVIEGGGAAVAGLRGVSWDGDGAFTPGDFIQEVEGRPVASMDHLHDALEPHAPGETVSVTVLRGGQKVVVDVMLQESEE